jgi:hypothetical protein
MSAIDEVHINSIYQALGFKGTPMQLERYNDKYKQAKDGKFSIIDYSPPVISLVTPVFCSLVEHPCLPSGGVWWRYHRRHC